MSGTNTLQKGLWALALGGGAVFMAGLTGKNPVLLGAGCVVVAIGIAALLWHHLGPTLVPRAMGVLSEGPIEGRTDSEHGYHIAFQPTADSGKLPGIFRIYCDGPIYDVEVWQERKGTQVRGQWARRRIHRANAIFGWEKLDWGDSNDLRVFSKQPVRVLLIRRLKPRRTRSQPEDSFNASPSSGAKS